MRFTASILGWAGSRAMTTARVSLRIGGSDERRDLPTSDARASPARPAWSSTPLQHRATLRLVRPPEPEADRRSQLAGARKQAMTTARIQTRAEIQAAIVALRGRQRGACIPSTAREYAADVDVLLDKLLALEPEPA